MVGQRREWLSDKFLYHKRASPYILAQPGSLQKTTRDALAHAVRPETIGKDMKIEHC